MPPTPLGQQQTFDYSSELDTICNVAVSNSSATHFQRSQSVPPLPQHSLLDKRFHPLTPQTDNRVQQNTPSPMETNNQHNNSLKELRNRVLHGDVNNNGSRTNENAAFTARRNLTTMLNAETRMDNGGNNQASLWHGDGFQTGQTGSSSSEEQEMEMLETNLNFSDLTSDGDLNGFDEATTEAVLRNICNNTSGVWPTTDVTSWPTQQPLQIMD